MKILTPLKKHPVVAIVQARMSSSRLPGKVLLPLGGLPVLWHVVNRARSVNQIQEVVVATSSHSSDDQIEDWCAENNVACFRGSLEDVLDRFYQAAVLAKAQSILRITADCPAIDPGILKELIDCYLEKEFDYCSLSGEFPDGLDCEIFTIGALAKARAESKLPSEREHVTPYLYNNPHIFKVGHISPLVELHHHRWTLDHPDDYRFLTAVFGELFEQNELFSTPEILTFLAPRPELVALNNHIIRNEGYMNSLIDDVGLTKSN